MGKRGPKPQNKVKIKWSANFAYVIGLLVTDGSLSKDGRHLCFTSKDIEQIKNFQECLNIKDIKIGVNFGEDRKHFAYRVQFGDTDFYKFLFSIGITSNKSKTIGKIFIPPKYFFDFLRGSFDGDGSFYSYWDPRWRSSHMFYLTFNSASIKHTSWIQEEINCRLHSRGHISKSKRKGSIYSLRYAKKQALEIIKKMYYNPKVVSLSRKRVKIQKTLKIERIQQKKYALVM